MEKNEKYELTEEEYNEAMTNAGKVHQKVVQVLFKNYYTDKSYEDYGYNYFVPADMIDLKAGDYVVVETRYGLTLGLIKDFVDYGTELYSKASLDSKIVCKVPYENYYEKKRKIERAKEIKKSLDAMLKKADEVQKYEMLRSIFPDAGSLIDELKDISK